MGIFSKKIKTKDVELFLSAVTTQLEHELPNSVLMNQYASLVKVGNWDDSESLNLRHNFDADYFNKNESKHNTWFRLLGIEVFNNLTDEFEEIPLEYSFDIVHKIEVKDPLYFHRNYNLEKIKVGTIIIKDLLDKSKPETLLVILGSDINKDKLEINSSIEIEIEDEIYHTVLDFDDGNCIAVNEQGVVFRLIHDHQQIVKEIAPNIHEFITSYNGDKNELSEKLWQ
jgi:hypothetical protein